MDDSAAFYKTFFQYDTLFRIKESVAAETVEQEKAAELPLSDKNTPVPPQQEPAEGVGRAEVTKEIPPAITKPNALATAQPTVQFPALQHRILVLVEEKKQADLLPEDAMLLENILKATGHSISETDILNFSSLPTADARAVLSSKSTNYFITFGVPLIKLQLDLLLPPYTPKYVEGIWFLLADPLSVINANKELKKRLWVALQQMFKVG